MRWWKIEEEFPKQEDGTGRTVGVCHLSDVIGGMTQELFNKNYRGSGDEEADTRARLQWEKGYAWERALEHAYGDGMAVRPGEFVKDGIYCSPDGLGVGITMGDGGRVDCVVLEEYKCTTFSATRTPDDTAFWRWMAQIKAYCYVVGCRHAVLRVLFLKGDYKDPTPAYGVFGFEFTEMELVEFWESVVNYAKERGMI